MISKIPSPYVEQSGCHDCEHVFIMTDYDCGEDYFCAQDGVERPPCGSVGMAEVDWDDQCERSLQRFGPFFCSGSIRTRLNRIRGLYARDLGPCPYTVWNAWSTGRRVKSWATCSEWTKREEV